MEYAKVACLSETLKISSELNALKDGRNTMQLTHRQAELRVAVICLEGVVPRDASRNLSERLRLIQTQANSCKA